MTKVTFQGNGKIEGRVWVKVANQHNDRHFKQLRFIEAAESWMKKLDREYTPTILYHQIEAYLSIDMYDRAFGRFLDARNAGLTSPQLLFDFYLMIFKKCMDKRDPCLYIVNELRHDLVQEGVKVQNVSRVLIPLLDIDRWTIRKCIIKVLYYCARLSCYLPDFTKSGNDKVGVS